MLKYLLDTNIIIYTIKNRPQRVRETFNRRTGALAISTVTLGELIYGAERSAQPERNLSVVEEMAERLAVLPFDAKAASQSAQVRAELYRIGTPIGPYDMMIAGHARAEGLVLVTNNMKEFERVGGLRLENWV